MTTSENEYGDAPTVVISFGDDVGTFRAHRTANQFLLARHANDTSGTAAIHAAVALVTDQVLPDERPALEQFLFEHGRDDGFLAAIYEGLSDCWNGETSLPFGPSSESSSTTLSPETDSPSTDDSPSPDTQALLPGLVEA